jgi:carbon storage regulator
MLVLSRKVGEQIVIGDNITVVVNKVAGNRISLGIEAPAQVRIVRGELKEAVSAFDDDQEVPSQRVALPALALVSETVVHRAR